MTLAGFRSILSMECLRFQATRSRVTTPYAYGDASDLESRLGSQRLSPPLIPVTVSRGDTNVLTVPCVRLLLRARGNVTTGRRVA
jgi:hypothetical protein